MHIFLICIYSSLQFSSRTREPANPQHREQDTTMPTYVIRHGYRLSYERDKKDIRASKKLDKTLLDRAKSTDDIDEPLGSKGHSDSVKTGKNLVKVMKHTKGKPIKVFCSPMTRCVQTAVHIVDELRKSHPCVKICIEYGLAEKLWSRKDYEFDKKGNMKIKRYKHVVSDNGKIYHSPIDNFLALKNIVARNKGYIDESYKSPVKPQKYVVDDGISDCFALAAKCCHEMNLDNANTNIIVTHALQCVGIYGYLNKKLRDHDQYKFYSRKGTNITFGWDKKIIYGPTRDFLN